MQEKEIEKVQRCEKGFHPTSASIPIQKMACRRRMLTRPKPQCHCVRILREQRKPAISLPLPQAQRVRQRPSQRNEKKKRTEAQKQNERPVLPQENGRRQTAVQFDPHLPTSRTQDPVDMAHGIATPGVQVAA